MVKKLGKKSNPEKEHKRSSLEEKDFQLKKVLFYDKLAKHTIYIGGIVTIVAVLGILIFVFGESLPLWLSAETNQKAKIALKQSKPLLVGIDEYQEILYAVTDSGKVDFIKVANKEILKSEQFELLENEKISSFSKTLQNNSIALSTNLGRTILAKIDFEVTFDEDETRHIAPVVNNIEYLHLDTAKKNDIIKMKYRVPNESSRLLALLYNDNDLFIEYQQINENQLEETFDTIQHKFHFNGEIKERIITFDVDNSTSKVLIATESGRIYFFSFNKDDGQTQLIQTFNSDLPKDVLISSMNFVFGDQSIVVGDSKGNLFSLMIVNDDDSEYGWKLKKTHIFGTLNSEITSITSSKRNKTFIVGTKNGLVQLMHLTSERKIVELKAAESEIIDISYSPKNDGAAVLLSDGNIVLYQIDAPHPEVTVNTLFGKVWYEGYAKPEYVWQSTGGSDDFEPKISLIPLIIGTIKGTLYALIFAIPIALLGAIYTSLFAHPKIRNIIKPVVEIMAALPSVVIGFLAGIWLAPVLEKYLPTVFVMFFIMPALILIAVLVWMQLPKLTGKFIGNGWEIVFIIPLLIVSGFLAYWLGPLFEDMFLQGDFRTWLKATFDVEYDQRNAIIVGFAMGFAVIPIIFTICEDSLTSVPEHLKSSSLALGATRWQTAVRIVLPTASPGIFSAVMIGFGRAIGETMIVLMATGNTPILDFGLFNGMRTLSANIAVEIPEAPMAGTLYRVLFLSATLLFIMTFIINTVAEIVRQRLRKKYMHI